MSINAILRPPSKSFIKCLSKHPEKNLINIERAITQHNNYSRYLAELGCVVHKLPPKEKFPDGCFVEDRCIIEGDLAIICPSSVKSRQGEEDDIKKLISKYKQIYEIKKPGNIDGGDIIIIGNNLHGRVSKRTNLSGLKQLAKIVKKKLSILDIPEHFLHLKTISTYIGTNTILVRDDMTHIWEHTNYNIIKVPKEEAYASNCIAIENNIIIPKYSAKTIALLRTHNYHIFEIEITEFQKGDGSLTCLTLFFSE